MPAYRCHLIDEDGELSGVEIIVAVSDHVAALATDRLLPAKGAAELWLGDVRVYRAERGQRRSWACR
jgi:hypothetical protein